MSTSDVPATSPEPVDRSWIEPPRAPRWHPDDEAVHDLPEPAPDIDAFLADIGRSVDAISRTIPDIGHGADLALKALSERINDKRQQLRGES